MRVHPNVYTSQASKLVTQFLSSCMLPQTCKGSLRLLVFLKGKWERLVRCMAPPAHSSPPPVPSPLLPSSGCPTQIQTLRIASTQTFIDAVTTGLPSPPLPPLPPLQPSLYIHLLYEIRESSTARPTKGRGIDYGFVSTVDAKERRQGIRDVGYGIRDTWVDPAEAVPEIAPMTMGEVNTRVTELVELYEHDTQDLYALLEDAQDSRRQYGWWRRRPMLLEKVDKYISRLPENIYGNVKSARPKTLDETIELANDLMDQKLRTYTPEDRRFI
ncbi:hypothetical protein Tco_0988766 [Tanacetum coccineum]|uniref:Uncharacterized protein n=1 Tax=Tanacetum coccineum TaxID=301880 RepID=A0ABQ5ET78_9ASTR